MKKFTYFLTVVLMSFIGALNVHADDWAPSTRAAVLEEGKTYLIFNAHANSCYGFLYDNEGSGLGLTKSLPRSFTNFTVAHFFTVEPQADGSYFLKAQSGKYVGPGNKPTMRPVSQ